VTSYIDFGKLTIADKDNPILSLLPLVEGSADAAASP
jgi:hypothetical protein